jgi:hypothetical protein
MELTNQEANSPLGVASRELAFAIASSLHKDWREFNIDGLQAGLYYYGSKIAEKSVTLTRTGF